MDEGKNGGVVDGKTDEQTDKQTDWKNGELYRKLSTVTTSLSGTKKDTVHLASTDKNQAAIGRFRAPG